MPRSLEAEDAQALIDYLNPKATAKPRSLEPEDAEALAITLQGHTPSSCTPTKR